MEPELGPDTSANEVITPDGDEDPDFEARRRARRERRQVYTFLGLFAAVLVVGLVAAGVYWRAGTVSAHTLADAAALCPAGTTTTPSKVQVVVWNSTTRVGIAGATAKSLSKRGFDVLGTGNADSGPVTGVATVTYGMYGRAQAQTVALEMKGKVKLNDDGRASTLVEVTLGEKFAGLRSAGQAAAAIARKPAPAGCVQPDSQGDLSDAVTRYQESSG